MSINRYPNISLATKGSLEDLLSRGQRIDIRGHEVRELRNRVTVIERPEERCLFVPQRLNDITASLAETLWVLAGRDDVDWLETFLPRARDYSDDGRIWRAAYGPRLRNWHGLDQLAEVLRLIEEEQTTRRAAMVLFDPAQDYADSKDIPCTNWLHWLARDGRLNLTVGIRSNDVMWGFSGVNSFEWSLLQSLMAMWSGLEVGDVTYLAPSFHLYERHYSRAREIVTSFQDTSCYDYGLCSPPLLVSFDEFDQALDEWFTLEQEVRNNAEAPLPPVEDPFLSAALGIVRVHHGAAAGWADDRIGAELAELPESDLIAACFEFYSRKRGSVLSALSPGPISDFMTAYLNPEPVAASQSSLVEAVKRLHMKKDRVYGTSWKKRGEMTSVLSNVARKVDRLIQFDLESYELPDESALDTAADLFVYALKYRLFLLEKLPNAAESELFELSGHDKPPSENVEAFGLTADKYKTVEVPSKPTPEIIRGIEAVFDAMHLAAERDDPIPERLALATTLADSAFALTLRLEEERPGLVNSLG